MDAKEKRKLERKRKQERAALDKKIQEMNAKYNTSFYNPDKHLVYQGVLRVTFVRNFVDNTKSLVTSSVEPAEKIIPLLVQKFMIEEDQHAYSLYEANRNGDETVLDDKVCPLAHTLGWDENFSQYFILLKLDAKKLDKKPEIQEQPEEDNDEAGSMEDYGYQVFVINMSSEMLKIKAITKKCNGHAEALIKAKDNVDSLADICTPNVLQWGALIKELVAKVTDMSVHLTGLLKKQVELYKSALTSVFSALVQNFKKFKVKANVDNSLELITRVRELKAYCLLADQVLTGVLSIDCLLENTKFILDIAEEKENKLHGSAELCPLFLQHISRASLIPTSVDKSEHLSALEEFLESVKFLFETLTTCADYVLQKHDQSLKHDEKAVEEAINEARLAVKRAGGFWPPPGTLEAFMIAVQRVVLAAATYIFQAKRCKILRNTTLDVTTILAQECMGDFQSIQGKLEKKLDSEAVVESIGSPKMKRLPLLQLSADRNKLKAAYNINKNVQKTVHNLCIEIGTTKNIIQELLLLPEYDSDVHTGRWSDDYSKKLTRQVRELLDTCNQIKDEIDTMELPRVDNDTQTMVFNAKRPIPKSIRAVNLACLIATGFWPPPESASRLSSQINVVVKDTTKIEPAVDKVLENQKHYYVDITSWEAEQAEWQMQAASGGLRITSKPEGLPDDQFRKLLESQSNPDLLFEEPDENGIVKVKGGTLDNLVKHLTYHGTLDTERIAFSNIFILTFHSFTTPNSLMDKLIVRYSMKIPPGFSSLQKEEWNNTLVVPTRIRILSVIKAWMTSSWNDFFMDPGLVQRFETFAELLKKDMPTATGKLCAQMKKYLTYGVEKQETVSTGNAPKSILPKHMGDKMTLMDIDPLEVARQLTLIDWEIYKKIRPSETYGLSWNVKEKQHMAQNILGLINRANDVSLWIATELVSQDKLHKRIDLLKHFITIAEKCVELNNFNAMFSFIAAGLSAGCVSRLTKTWEGLPSRSKEVHATLTELIKDDQSYRNYRGELSKIVDKPCIPFLGIYLTDLTFIEEGNPDCIKGSSPKKINFSKRRIFSNTLHQMLKFQAVPYNLNMVNPINKALTNFDLPYNEDDLYGKSREIEPPEE